MRKLMVEANSHPDLNKIKQKMEENPKSAHSSYPSGQDPQTHKFIQFKTQ